MESHHYKNSNFPHHINKFYFIKALELHKNKITNSVQK